MEVESSNNQSNKKEVVLERAGQDTMVIKLANNEGKKSETAKKPLRKRLQFRKTLGRRNYIGNRNKPGSKKTDIYNNERTRRQRGIGLRRRGVKIIVRNLTRNATNQDIRSIFEKIGPLKRCGINWNNLGESKGTADVEFYYRRDAYKACKKLDFKSIRGVPIRLEMREGGRRVALRSLGRGRERPRRPRSFGATRRFRSQRNFRRDERDNRRRRSSNRTLRRSGSADNRRGLRNRGLGRRRLSARRGSRKN